MLKHGEVNPLDVFGLRQVDYCPPHFEIITFNLRTSIKSITDWIYENLSGRFYIGDYIVHVDESQTVKKEMIKIVAFELHEEASYFGLFLPSINKNDFDLGF